MNYLFDHTVFFEANPVYLIPLAVMLVTFVFCVVRVLKMRKEALELRSKLSSEIAEDAFVEPMMEHTIEDEAPTDEASK